ncbi:ribosome biogenesis protein BMS1/TSR1 [Ochromonadaceae sp. CCMP2298]|nr:ribosome biogenesis protein BMS1/TSR1 [Ochromonadaceae sp. CCMP2298]
MRRARQQADDEQFPDEVDTPDDIPARQRFARYRALQSFRASPWHAQENLPTEYARLFQFENFAGTQRRLLAESLAAEKLQAGFLAAGQFVCLELEKVPMAVAGRLAGRGFLLCCGLYRHEQKLSVLHFGLTKHSACVETIKSKDELLFVAGFRSFIGRPAFSESNLNCDKHKFERFLLPDRFCVASVFGPVCVPATPLLSRGSGAGWELVATGSLMSVDPDRITLKKVRQQHGSGSGGGSGGGSGT